jgi:[protein-PII] uridylyltransferase
MLRSTRDELIADYGIRGAAFGAALAGLVDRVFVDASAELHDSVPWALVALGSYATRTLCPGSDIDVMLLHAEPQSGDLGNTPSRLWYPLWDAGFVLGQSVRTMKEALAVADRDLDALTSLLELRLVAGDESLVAELAERVRGLAVRRRGRVIAALSRAAADRLARPGPIAEMLEPNLKEGAGGLRDVQAPGWTGWALPHGGDHLPEGWEGGVAILAERGYIQRSDIARLRAARSALLDTRVALHRVTGGRSDRLALQDQDAVARLVGAVDADELVRSLGEAARSVVWITTDLWARLRATEHGPANRGARSRELADSVLVRDGRVALGADATVDAALVLTAAAHAARLQVPFERETLARMEQLEAIDWTPAARHSFVSLLAAGRGAIPVFESLDHIGVLVRLLPEWEHIRARPQRNAYHRFTVDRHSLEAVAECAALLDPENPEGRGLDGEVARRARTDVLLLAALFHDIAKGTTGDHSVVGAEMARAFASRIGIDAEGRELLGWAVRYHLALADSATRRDLSDEWTVARFAQLVADHEHNDLLYALTISDSRATGPAAWNSSKAALVRELFAKTDTVLRHGEAGSDLGIARRAELSGLIGAQSASEYVDAMPSAYASAFSGAEQARHRELLAARALAVDWASLPDERLRTTVVAPDRTGLLATVAATLALAGFDITAAAGYTHRDGMALEVFTGVDRFGRLASPDARAAMIANLDAALRGELQVEGPLRERTRRYRPARAAPIDRDVRVVVDSEASAFATIVEVYAPDDIGLLARVASTLSTLGLDVVQAIVSTQGERVVDVFYVRDVNGRRVVDQLALDSLRATLLARLTTEVTLDGAGG